MVFNIEEFANKVFKIRYFEESLDIFQDQKFLVLSIDV